MLNQTSQIRILRNIKKIILRTHSLEMNPTMHESEFNQTLTRISDKKFKNSLGSSIF